MGKRAHRRRDRRRAARRRHRDRLRAARARVRRLHGRRRHGAPGAQRLSHARARRRRSSASTPAAATLKDAINEAMRDWVANVETTYYLLGSVLGPHPYPLMVREFQSVIGQEARQQILDGGRPAARRRRRLRRRRQQRDGHLRRVRGRRGGAAGRRRGRRPRDHAGRSRGAIRRRRTPACCTARAAWCCRTTHGNILPTHSISAGLDYPSVGPEHAWLAANGRTEYDWIDDRRCARRASSGSRGTRASCRRSSRRTPWPGCSRQLAGVRAGRSSSSTSRAAATRTSRPCGGSSTRGPGSMSRIEQTFRRAARPLADRGLVAYVTAGDPDLRALGRRHSRARARRRRRASRSACRSPIRSPTARRFNARRNGRSPPGASLGRSLDLDRPSCARRSTRRSCSSPT